MTRDETAQLNLELLNHPDIDVILDDSNVCSNDYDFRELLPETD